MIVLFRIQDVGALEHHIDLAAMMQEKLPFVDPSHLMPR